MAQVAITPRQPASGARRLALLAFAAVLLVVATPTSPAAAAMLVDPVAYSARACSITGTGRADRLSGTAGDDRVCGLGGADRIRGERGHDLLVGGAGGDLLQGKAGRDRLEGASGNDRAFGGAGGDDLRGGAGRDALGGGLGPDQLSGGPGRDIAYFGQRTLPVRVTIGAGANDGTAGEGDNVHADVEDIQTGPGNDVVRGSGGANRLIGAGGNDQLFGARGSDVLVGGDGDDRLDAREGATAAARAAQAGFVDRVVCGGGNDTALVDPVDIVDPGCENVIGASGTTPPAQGPPAQGPPAQGPPAPQNQAPTAVDDSATVGEDSGAGAIAVLVNDTDSDGGPKLIVSVTQPGHGTVVITGGGTGLTYEPDANFCGSDAFEYTLNGGSTATVSVAVTCVDDPPTAVNDSTTVAEDAAAGAIAVLANDTDTDGGAMTIASSSDPGNGTVVLTGGSPGAHTGLTYKPDPNYCNSPPGTAPDTFTYTLNGGSTATVSVTVTCVEDLAMAVNDDATVPEDSAATPLAVLANDSDPDGDPITIASVSDPANGTVVLTGGLPGAHTGLTYAPDPNYCSATPDTFTYTLNGGSTATVSVTVTCGDDPPTAVNDIATVGEDSGAGAIAVLANDTDSDGGAMTIASASDPANGTVVLTGGSPGAHTGLTYQPDTNFCSATPDTFTYTLNGGSTATVSVTVTCVDDAPTAVDDSATVAEDSAAGAIDVLANDTDADGGAKTISSALDPAHGTVVLTGGSPGAHTGLTYQPDANFCGADSFTYTVNGGSQATVSVTVTCADDAPTAVDDADTVPEDSAATPLAVLANDTDSDGGPMTIASASDPANGTVVLTGGLPGAHIGLTYQPDPNYCNSPPGTAPDTFTYTLTGGSTATVSVTVTCGDDAPTAVNDSATVAEDSAAGAIAVLANDTDSDGGAMTIASASDPANGTVVLTGGSPGAHTGLTYQPDANFCSATPDTFTYTLNGGSTATVSVTVTCVDDPPTAVGDSATAGEDSVAAAIDVLANDTDADGGPKTISSASDPANGTVVLTGGSPGARTGLTYQPDANFCGADSFTYTLTGGSQATVSITVTCVADNPVVDTSAGSTGYTENAAATVIDAAVTVNDPDAGTTITGATVKITGAGAEDVLALGGSHPDITASFVGDTLTLTGNATAAAYQSALRDVTYRNSSDNPSTAARTVTFTVTDDTALSGSDTKGLTVTAVDDPPTAVNDSATVLEDAAATAITVLTNDTDLDGGTKTISSVTQPANGTVVITGVGTGLTYQPNPNYCNNPPGTTPSTFTYTLNGGSTATVSVTVTCVNDAPQADDETFDGANGAIGNTSLVYNAPGDGAPTLNSPKKSISGDLLALLAGDTDIDGPGPLTVTPGTFTTNDGGSVTIEADGDFIYINDPADNCADTSDFFDYTVSDGNAAGPGPTPGTDTGRVTIAVAGCVWYVNNNDPNGNAGTSTAPFDTLTQAETASANNHTVFVFDSTTAYGDNGYVMNSGERLIGEHEGLTVDPDQGGPLAAQTLHPANPDARPNLTATGADVIDLDDANEVRGFDIDPSGAGGGIAGSTGDVSGTIDDVNINDTGTAGTQPGLELDGTTGTFAVSNLTINTNGATGVRLNNPGTVSFAPTGTISITTSGGPALTVATAALSGTIDSTTTTSSPTTGISLTTTTGSLTLDDVNLTTTGTALTLNNANDVTVNNTGDADVTSTGRAIDVTNGPTTQPGAPDVVLDQVTSSGGTVGINIDGIGAGTFSAAGGALSGHTSAELDINGGSGNITYPGTINNGSGLSAQITGRSGGTVAIAGNINDTNDAGGGIDMSTNTGGTFNFSGTTKKLDTGTSAAFSSTGSSPTINLTGGGLDIDTTSATGFGVSGGGTLSVTGSGNSATATTGSALSVVNTTITASDLNFQSISSSGGSATGIILDTTGTTGGLTVTGDGTNTTRGGNGSGGTIANKSGPDGATTTGNAIYLNSAAQVTLRRMTINGTNANFGILATNSREIALEFSTVNGANGNNVALDEGSISYSGLTVSGSIADSIVGGGFEDNLRLVNTSGSLNRMVISNSTFDQTGGASSNNNLLIESQNAGTVLNFTLQGSTIRGARADWVNAASNSSSSMDAVINGNTFSNLGASANANAAPGGNRLVLGTIGTLTYNIDANSFNGSLGEALRVRGSGAASGLTGTAIGRITNNLIGTAATANSGSSEGSGIFIFGDGGSDNTALISGNTIRQYNNHAISLTFGDEINNGAVNNVTVTNNNANTPGTINDNFNGFQLNNGTVGATDDFTTCLELANNNITGSGKGSIPPNNGDVRLRQRQATTVRLPGYTGPARDAGDNDVAEVVTFLRPPGSGGVKNNTFGTGFAGSAATGGGYIGTGGACVTPP